jgi:dipeptidyl aminopeptidase/acylaminoacyl peptidase
MDIHQLRSWVFELYEPLTADRTYLLLHEGAGTLVDLPPFSTRIAHQIRGVCDPQLVFFTHAGRSSEIERWRDTLRGVRYAIHEADAEGVPVGVDLRLQDGDLLPGEPEARIIHIGARTAGASMVLVRVPGGVLLAGDGVLGTEEGTLSLPDDVDPERMRAGLEKLRGFEFSAVLSTRGRPVWSAAKERYLELLNGLPRPRRRFGYLVDAPWDRAYLRVRSQMAHNPIVPQEETIAAAAAHGPTTLVPAWERTPLKEVAWGETLAPAGAPPESGDSAPSQPRAEAARPSDGARQTRVSPAERKRWSLATEAARALPPKPPGPVQTVPGELLEPPVAFRRLSAQELAHLPHVDWRFRSFDLSRDGEEVVFSWDPTGVFEIYRAPLAGDAIYQLTAGERRALQPRLSPDGRSVAFLRESDDERLDLWIVDRDGAQERKLIEVPGARREPAWSPDGSRIAYVSEEDAGTAALYVLDLAARRARVIARDLRVVEDAENRPSWSRDGRLIAYHSAAEPPNVDLYVVSADGEAAPERIETRGGAAGQSRSPRFGPRDEDLAFATDLRGRWEVAILALRDGRPEGEARFLRDSHFDETDPVWDVEPGRLLYRRTAEGLTSVRRAYLVSSDDEPVLDAAGVHFAVSLRPDGGLVYHFSGAREPADLFLRGRGELVPQRITRSLPSSIPAGLFVEPRSLRYLAPDGTSVPALLYLPHREALDGSGERPPAILYAHDGPTAQHAVRFDGWAQWFANRGYAVLAPNVRGSTGYGRAHREANRDDLGGGDVEDLLAGAEWLSREEIADERRIAAFGIGYGGYLALLALARAPERFAAGCDVLGPTALGERSPITLAERIRAPLLLLHNGRAAGPPSAEPLQLVEALRARGRAFSFHSYDSGGPLLSHQDRRDALERVAEFFDEHVKRSETASRA